MKLFLFCVAAVAHGQPIDSVAKEWKYAERDNEVLDNYLKENTFGWWSRKLAKMVHPDLSLTMVDEENLTMSVLGPLGYTGDFKLKVNGCADMNFFKEPVTICTSEEGAKLKMEATFHDGTLDTRIPQQTVVFESVNGQLVQTISSPTSSEDLVVWYEAK